MKCQSFSPKNNLNDAAQFSEDMREIYIWKNFMQSDYVFESFDILSSINVLFSVFEPFRNKIRLSTN